MVPRHPIPSGLLAGRLSLLAMMAVAIWLAVVSTGSAASGAAPVIGTVSQPAAVPSEPEPLPEQMTRDEIRTLLSRLSDSEVRELLLRQLDKAAVDTGGREADLVGESDNALALLRERLALMIGALPRLHEIGPEIVNHVSAGQGTGHLAMMGLAILLMVVGGLAVERLFRRLFKRFADTIEQAGTRTLFGKLCILMLVLVRDLLGIAVFGITAVGVFFLLYQGHEPTREIITAVLLTILIIRVTSAVVCFAVTPDSPWLRITPLDDTTARTIYRRSVLIVASITVAYYLGECLEASLAKPDLGFFLLIGMVLSGVITAIIIALVWVDRKTVARLMTGEAASPDAPVSRARQMMADNWHIFVTCFLVGVWLLGNVKRLITGESVADSIILSLCILVALPVIDWVARAVLTGLLGVSGGPPEIPEALSTADMEPLTEGAEMATESGTTQPMSLHDYETRLQYRDVLVRNLRIVIGVVSLLALAGLWNIDIRGMAAEGVGDTVAGALFDIIITLILAPAVWGIVKTAITQAVAGEDGAEEPEPGEIGGKGGTRLQTLVPLFGKFCWSPSS